MSQLLIEPQPGAAGAAQQAEPRTPGGPDAAAPPPENPDDRVNNAPPIANAEAADDQPEGAAAGPVDQNNQPLNQPPVPPHRDPQPGDPVQVPDPDRNQMPQNQHVENEQAVADQPPVAAANADQVQCPIQSDFSLFTQNNKPNSAYPSQNIAVRNQNADGEGIDDVNNGNAIDDGAADNGNQPIHVDVDPVDPGTRLTTAKIISLSVIMLAASIGMRKVRSVSADFFDWSQWVPGKEPPIKPVDEQNSDENPEPPVPIKPKLQCPRHQCDKVDWNGRCIIYVPSNTEQFQIDATGMYRE